SPGAAMNGIVPDGRYVPYYRIDRKTIADALGVAAAKGARAVASYDEDATSMGVEAARVAMRGSGATTPPAVYFAPPPPPYLDKTNAPAIHAALGLPETAAAYDMAGSVR